MPKAKKRESLLDRIEIEKQRLKRQEELQEQKNKNIELIQIETKERSLRTAILDESATSFENFRRTFLDHKASIKEEDEWTSYLKCENLPNTKHPSEVREFQYKWQTSLDEHWNQQINWWLKCDDRSVLSQDINNTDVRRTLIKKLREPTGKFYDEKLRLLLKVYNSLSDTLRRKKISDECLKDLITIHDEFRKTCIAFLDVLTFQVSMRIDREMTSVNPLIAQYSFKAPDFVKFIWTYKGVTLPEDKKRQVIKMDPLHMSIDIAKNFDLSSAIMRGLWFKHDFLSDHAPSYNPRLEMNFTSLPVALQEELKIRNTMIDERLKKLQKIRKVWEFMMEEKLRQEEEDKMMKNKKSKSKKEKKVEKPKKSKKLIKEPLEPPIIDETTHVDVDEEYVAYEDLQYQKERETLMPENLGLSNHEVNMREYHIINGILKIESFKRQLQTKEIDFKMFLQLHEHPNILKPLDFHHVYEAPKLVPLKDERKTMFGQKVVDSREKALRKLFKVEVKLSEKFLWNECPTVCRWEPWEKSEEFNKLDPKVQDFNLHFDDHAQREQEKLFAAPKPKHYKRKVQLRDFDLKSPPDHVQLSVLFKHFIVPLMPDEFKFFHDQYESFKMKRREWLSILEAKKLGDDANLEKLFDQLKMKFNVSHVTIEEFLKLFEAKSFHPRNLFPIEELELIEVLEDLDVKKSVEKSRDEFKSEAYASRIFENIQEFMQFVEFTDDRIDIGEEKPFNNLPMALSDLLKQIESLRQSLRPFHQEAQKNKISINSSREDTAVQLKPLIESPPDDKSLRLIPHYQGKWTTQDIHETSYDSKSKLFTFYTGRLGTFAFATRKYCNLPFKFWEILPTTEDGAKSIMMNIETQNGRIEIKITNDGYTFKLNTNARKDPFHEIKIPVKVFELKRILQSLNFDLFPEVDASCYVENISEKHKPMELHTYKSMAVYCLSHHFKWNAWNRWAHRRVMIFESRMIDKPIFRHLMVTPLRTTSVDVREQFTDLEVVRLDYDLNPSEQEFHPDVLDFLKDDVDKKDHRANLKSYAALWFAQALLLNVQPLSFSQ